MQPSENRPNARPSEVIAELARRIRCLCPNHRDPQKFHEEKSDIEHELRKLARRVG